MAVRIEGDEATRQFTSPRQTLPRGQTRSRLITAYALSGLSIILFVAGFLGGEDGFGGNVRSDLYSYHEPTIWAFRNHPLLSVLPNYESATTPLFHILESFNPLLGHDAAFRAANTLFALLTCGLFVYAIRLRFKTVPGVATPALLVGASVLLSPYFRAETYWVSTDVLPIFSLIATAILLNPLQDDAANRKSTVTPWILVPSLALLSWSCFYCRQTYLFVPFYVFLILLWRLTSRWWWSVLNFAVFGAPAVYLVHLWKGLTPPHFRQHQGFSIDAVVQPLSMIFIYSVPFLLSLLVAMKKPDRTAPKLRSAWLYLSLLAGLVGFILVFHGFHFTEENRGGGVASKILSHYGDPGRYLFLLISYLGLLVVWLLCRPASWKGRILVVSFLLPTFAMTFFFQRYYDPLLLVLFVLLWERSAVSRFMTARTAYLVMAFNAALLVGALAYNGRTEPVYLPLASHPRPWTEVVRYRVGLFTL